MSGLLGTILKGKRNEAKEIELLTIIFRQISP